MTTESYASLAERHLNHLCITIPDRVVGSPGNQAASAYIREQLERCGARVQPQPFDCLDYRSGAIQLSAGPDDAAEEFEAFISPYSLPCDLQAPLAQAASLDELRAGDFRGKLLLLSGELTREQLMPKNFMFYNPDSHQEIHHLLAEKEPAAILTATGQNSELAGAPYPFPMIEDGDFDIPVAYLTDREGDRLAAWVGQPVRLRMDAERIPSRAENVSAAFGPQADKRFVVCAHLDAKRGSPGAVDNAGGIVTLLLLAERLAKRSDCPALEILAINGEDHYSAGGEMAYLGLHAGKLDRIRLVVNIDGAGYRGFNDALSFYGTAPQVESAAQALLAEFPTLDEGPTWPQSDHMVFAMNQVPAMAITTQAFAEMEKQVAHTAQDRPQVVDTALLAEAAAFIEKLILKLDQEDLC
ncbi:MAG: aminopeptidase YwaD [Chloroflexota bacterium]|nr:aminopeptidase YwaD [Chloroflexota bacterium]